MKLLVACEESQVVCKEFRNLNIEAYSCDLVECSGGNPEWHIIGDALKESYSGKYEMMIAHPPCTFLSNAGARWMYPKKGEINKERLKKAMIAKDFFMDLLNSPIKYIAIENPLPLKIVNLPQYSQIIQPYEFNEPFSKKTLLWLKNLPKLIPTNILENYKPFLPSNSGGKKRGKSFLYSNVRGKERSKTFKGIASAMANQWSYFLK